MATFATYKSSRTSRQTYITKLIIEADQEIAANNLNAVEDCLYKLEVKEHAWLLNNVDLIATAAATEVEAESDLNESFHDGILAAKIRMNRYLKQQAAIAAAAAAIANPVTTTVAPARATGATITAKLPKLQIARFEGTVADYERFWSQFNSGVHSNATISKSDKFNYLVSLLNERSRLTIKGLSITDSNYDVALKLIQDKYGKPDLLVDEHIRQLWHSRRVTQIGNGQELRLLYEEFQSHIQSLETLGKDVASMGALLCHILRQSLPRSLLIEWNRQTSGTSNDNLARLLDFVKTELEGVEAACQMVYSDPAKQNTTNLKKDSSVPPNTRTSSTLVATGSSGNNSQARNFSNNTSTSSYPPYCYFCDDRTHYSSTCSVHPTNKSRKESLARAKRCFNCLKKNHHRRDCEQQISCRICSKNHHTLLCDQRTNTPAYSNSSNSYRSNTTASRKQESTAAVVTKTTEEQQALVASSSSAQIKGSKQVSILQTMRVWIRTSTGAHQVTLLLDGGSERSFILASTAESLGLKSHSNEVATIRSFGGHKTQQQTSLVDFVLEGNNNRQLKVTALKVPSICQGVKLWESSKIERYLQDKRIYTWNQKMGPGELVNIDVLIGADYYWLLLTGHMKRLSDRLMATESILGWMLQGSADMHAPVKPIVSMLAIEDWSCQAEATTQQQLSRLWELDQTGILAKEDKSVLTLTDVEVLSNFEATTTYQDGRYQVRIPWKTNKDKLTSNFAIAKERLRRMLWKITKDPALYDRYKTGVFEYLANNHAEEVSLSQAGSPLYYMPHHAVIKEDRKTTKVRIVFDGSSCQDGAESLNTCQETGPSLNPPIFNLLLRFRWEAVAMVSDLEKAFLQILIHPDDRDAIRFLWTDRPWGKNEEPNLQVFRMSRVLFGMKSSPFLLAATIRLHVKTHPSSDERLSQYISDRIYVDDLLSGARDTPVAYALFKRMYNLFLAGGMKLTKWVTNDTKLREQWVTEGIAAETETIELLKVLGLLWNPATDCFSIRTTNLFAAIQEDKLTKRSMLTILASVFDPLGFLSPVTIFVKMFLQDLWKLKIGWDEAIPEVILGRWEDWKTDLKCLAELQVPRWLRSSDRKLYELHVFCDAGPRVYATVVYLRFQQSDGSWWVQLISARSRLAPIHVMSIPRLELMACLIGSRLAANIRETYLEAEFETQFWSDSSVALQWISDIPSRWKLFVARRVQEIQANTPRSSKWSYCPTKSNIADIMTRGQGLSKLLKNEEWWYGPHWLHLDRQEWSLAEEEINLEETSQLMLQEKSSEEVMVHLVVLRPALIEEDKFGSWRKLMRVTAWIQRFVHNCRQKERITHLFLTYQEIRQAELHWFAFMQEVQFSEELHALLKGQELSKHSSLYQFLPFLDDNKLIRLGGRLKFANVMPEQKHPIFLKGGGLTDLLILDRHLQTLHGGAQVTLAKMRTEIWILKGRQTVRRVIHGCRTCRRWTAKPATEIEAQLPAARVQETAPFFHTGVDFAGPINVKEGKAVVKSYICLFTCAVTRALHIELVATQGLPHFLLAFRRFIARRGGCKLIFSDNGSTFHQSDRLLRESYGHLAATQTQELAEKHAIEWRFISPKASWWGGFYERMVQSIKYHLRRSLGGALLTHEELYTLLTEIEAVINNRPLLRLSDDPTDITHLTPSHFLLGRTTDNLCDSLDFVQDVPLRQQLTKRWKYRRQLMNRFWKSWQNDYLLQLRTAHTVKMAAINRPTVQLNDVVLITEDKLPRGRWKMALVTELTPGRDGKIRSVMLQLPNKTLMRRAVQQICPLEVLD